MEYHFFELNGQRYRAWRTRRVYGAHTVYVEAITRRGLVAQDDAALIAYATRIIDADEQHDQKGA